MGKGRAYVVVALLVTATLVSYFFKRGTMPQTDPAELGAPQAVYVSVDASFMDSKSHLSFKNDHRLYVRAVISGTNPEQIVAGYLNIDGTQVKRTDATFDGGLSLYEWDDTNRKYVAANHTFNNEEDPLSECESIFAMLVEKNADNFTVCGKDKRGSFTSCIAPDANKLIKKCTEVFGWYDADTKCFALDSDNPGLYNTIVNYSINGGLNPHGAYDVFQEFCSSHGSDMNCGATHLGSITADAHGGVSFSCFNYCCNNDKRHEIRFVNKNNKDDVKLVQAMLIPNGKICDIYATATPEPHVMAMADEVILP